MKQYRLHLIFTFLFLIRTLPVIPYLSKTNYISSSGTDPLLYLAGARTILEGNNNPFNFFSPVYFYFLAAFLFLGKGKIIFPVLATAFVGWLTLTGIYQFSKRLFNEGTAFIALILTGIYPNLIFFGVNLYPETLTIFFIVYSFYMIVEYINNSGSTSYLLLGGILWGLASQTRGGLHFFSFLVIPVILKHYYQKKGIILWKPALIYLLATYLTIVVIGILAYPTHGEFALNSQSGIGSFVHGVNRITTSCPDYGDVLGNIFYDINNCVFNIKDCGEKWPEGTQIFSKDIFKLGTIQILLKTARFVADSPWIYIKNSLRKLSCFWSPNQLIIGEIKYRLQQLNALIVDGFCLVLILLYIFIICGGILGMSLSKEPLRQLFISLIIFYFVMIFLTVGNSKLRIPLMPFFIIYASFYLSLIKRRDPLWEKALFHKWVLIIIVIFLLNSIYKYREIALSPSEIYVRKIELCNELGFYRTVLYLYSNTHPDKGFNLLQKKRLIAAKQKALAHLQTQE